MSTARRPLQALVSSLPVLVLAGLVATAIAGPHVGKDQASATGSFLDLPVEEIALDSELPPVGAVDLPPQVFALPDSRVVVLGLEDFKLKAMVSSDGGENFGDEVLVAGGAGGKEVLEFDGSSDGLGRLAVALIVADPAGDRGLQFVFSDDFGLTWSEPRDLVVKGDPSHGVESVAISGAPEGGVAIAYISALGSGNGDPYAVFSGDGGATWKAPVRLDTDRKALSSFPWQVDVEIDAVGRPQVVWGLTDEYGDDHAFASRSLDAGTSFEPPRRLSDPVGAGPILAQALDLGISSNGGIVVALAGAGEITALYSSDGGASFSKTLSSAEGGGWFSLPRVISDSSSPVVLLAVSEGSVLRVFRSTSSGGGFTGPIEVARYLPWWFAWGTTISGTRTATGSWALAWMSYLNDIRMGQLLDIFVSVSADDGTTWSSPAGVDRDAPGTALSRLNAKGMATTGSDTLVLAYADGRDDGGGSSNLYLSRSSASSLRFSSTERRIDDDGPPVAPAQLSLGDPAVTADGADHAYFAFTACSPGPREDLFLAISDDKGETFRSFRRLGDSAPGSAGNGAPHLKAFPDGHVYLVYTRHSRVMPYHELRFNRSLDYGASWEPSDTRLYGSAGDFEAVVLDATSPGLVHVAYVDGLNPLVVVTSRDHGATFETSLSVDTYSSSQHPSLCAQGEQVIVTEWNGEAYVSEDGGRSWMGPTFCADDPSDAWEAQVACNGEGAAVVTCNDGGPSSPLHARRYERASGWSPSRSVKTPQGEYAGWGHRVAFSSPGRAVLLWDDGQAAVYAALSTDGGGTFSSYQRLDGVAPQPTAASMRPRIVGDGAGNLFASWLDGSAGAFSIVTRASMDDGASWGPVYRVDRETPQGVRENSYSLDASQSTAALEGRCLLAWAGQRESYNRKALFSAFDLSEIDQVSFRVIAPADGESYHPDSQPATFAWSRGAMEEFQLAWSQRSSMSGPKKTSGKQWLRGAESFTPNTSLWTSILKLGVTSGDVYWTVTARDQSGKTVTSPVRVLELAAAEAVNVTAPPDGASLSCGGSPPVISWEGNHNAGYRVVFSARHDMRGPTAASGGGYSLGTTSWQVSPNVWKKVCSKLVPASNDGVVYYGVYARDALNRRTATAPRSLRLSSR